MKRFLMGAALGLMALSFGATEAVAAQSAVTAEVQASGAAAGTGGMKLTLEEVISTAREQSVPALRAKHQFVVSYWRYRTYKAQFLPSLNLSANLGQYNRSLVSV